MMSMFKELTGLAEPGHPAKNAAIVLRNYASCQNFGLGRAALCSLIINSRHMRTIDAPRLGIIGLIWAWRQLAAKIVVHGTVTVALAQCGGNGKQGGSPASEECIPASVRRCEGAWSCRGGQTCSEDGARWSDCVCDAWGSDGGLDANATLDGEAVDLAPEAPPLRYVLVDDMEGATAPNGPIRFTPSANNGTPGFWESWRSSGSPSNTMAPDPYAYAPLPAPHQTMDGITSTTAAHLTCHIADQAGYCEQAFWLAQGPSTSEPGDAAIAGTSNVENRIQVDISAYQGLVFWAMSSKANRIKILLGNADTDALGGRCGQVDASADQCGDAFSKRISLTGIWTRYELKFSDLTQAGWGHAAPSRKPDLRAVTTIGFQIDGPQTSTASPVDGDFWIDDIYLTFQ
jgi:hypothetical protein